MEFTQADRELFTLRRWVGPTARRVAQLIEDSGLDPAGFAEAAGVDVKRVARLVERTVADQPGFDRVSVVADAGATGGALRIEVGPAVIRFGPGDDPALLRTAVEALRC